MNDDWTMYEMRCLNPIHGRPSGLPYMMQLGGKGEQAVCPECSEAKYSKFVCLDGSLVSDPKNP